jgi:hypothetical protein
VKRSYRLLLRLKFCADSWLSVLSITVRIAIVRVGKFIVRMAPST